MATPRTGKPRGRPRKAQDNYEEVCAKRYAAARRAKLSGKGSLSLHAATGDPLARDNEKEAGKVYELDGAKRPSYRMKEIRALAWGDSLDILVDYVLSFERNIGANERKKSGHLPSTRRELIADAIATFAERGSFIGDASPISFSGAMRATYERIEKQQEMIESREKLGDTGRTLQVRPAIAGSIVLDPETWRELPATGATVLDNAFWRRRIEQGDVIEF